MQLCSWSFKPAITVIESESLALAAVLYGGYTRPETVL